MNIITEPEYDEMVEDMASDVFDPLHPDDAVSEGSEMILDLVLDGRQEKAREEVHSEAERVVYFDHPLAHPGPVRDMDASTAGCILQHSDSAYGIRPKDVRSGGAEGVTVNMAAKALFKDVVSEAHSSIRSAVGEESDD